MDIALTCIEHGHKKEAWRLTFGLGTFTLTGPEDKQMGSFPIGEAEHRLRLPGPNNKRFTVVWDNGQLRFKVSRENLRLIRQMTNLATVGMGDEAIDRLRTAATRGLVGGFAVTVLGVAISVGSYWLAARRPQGGGYTVTYGLVVTGLVLMGHGYHSLRRYRDVCRTRDGLGD